MATFPTILTPRALSSNCNTTSTGSSSSSLSRGNPSSPGVRIPPPKAAVPPLDRRKKKVKQSSQKQKQQQQRRPSVLEVQRAIGAIDSDDASRSPGKGSSTMMDLLTSTPIGQAESSIERKFRETAEWMVEQTESRALYGQKTILVLCMKILPVWFLLLLVASGAIKLPFDIPFLDDLLA